MKDLEKTFYNLTEISEILVEYVKAMKSLNERLEVVEKQIGIKEKNLDKFAELLKTEMPNVTCLIPEVGKIYQVSKRT